MTGRTHKVGGMFAGVLVSTGFVTNDLVLSAVSVTAVVVGSTLGSLLPDIDKKESTVGKFLWFISWPIYFFRLFNDFLIALLPSSVDGVFKRIDRDTGHRGISHSLITWGILSAAFYYGYHLFLSNLAVLPCAASYSFLFGVSAGMLSHIFLDFLTTGGIALLCPLIHFRFKLHLVRTGSKGENIIRQGLLLMTLLFSYRVVIAYFSLQ